jgi:hypothetical protein
MKRTMEEVTVSQHRRDDSLSSLDDDLSMSSDDSVMEEEDELLRHLHRSAPGLMQTPSSQVDSPAAAHHASPSSGGGFPGLPPPPVYQSDTLSSGESLTILAQSSPEIRALTKTPTTTKTRRARSPLTDRNHRKSAPPFHPGHYRSDSQNSGMSTSSGELSDDEDDLLQIERVARALGPPPLSPDYPTRRKMSTCMDTLTNSIGTIKLVHSAEPPLPPSASSSPAPSLRKKALKSGHMKRPSFHRRVSFNELPSPDEILTDDCNTAAPTAAEEEKSPVGVWESLAGGDWTRSAALQPPALALAAGGGAGAARRGRSMSEAGVAAPPQRHHRRNTTQLVYVVSQSEP